MKTFKQFCIEADSNQEKEAREARGARDREINLSISWDNPGYRAKNYSYGGNTAPCKDDPTKDCPSQVRHTQDIKAAVKRSQERQKSQQRQGL